MPGEQKMSNFRRDFNWATRKIQPIAVRRVYANVWPNVKIIQLDKDRKNKLANILDIAGADKLIQFPDGGISFLAQRFRRYEQKKYDDFTLRRSRPSGHLTEAEKIQLAFKRNGFVAAFYSYALVNEREDGFLRFRIFDFLGFCGLWLIGDLEPDGIKSNADHSSDFYIWHFNRFPSDLWIYNSEPYQIGLGL